MAIDTTALAKRLKAAMPTTAQRSEEALAAAAANKYEPIYNAEVQSARQTQQQNDLSLSQRIERLLPEFDRNAESIQQNTAAALSTQNRQTLSRGMQRSSYNQAALGNIQGAGIAALGRNDRERTTQVDQINAQRSQLERQLAQTLGRLETDKAKNIAGYTDEMRQQDLKNALDGYDVLQKLELALADMAYKQDRANAADSQWRMTYDAKYAKKATGGSKASKKTGTAAAAAKPAATAKPATTLITRSTGAPITG